MDDTNPQTTPPQTPANPDPSTPATPTPSPAPAYTPEAIVKLVQQAVGPLAQEVAYIKQAINPPAPQTKPDDKEAAATAKVRDLATDPDSFLDKEVNRRVEGFFTEKAAPGLVNMIQNQRDIQLSSERERIDSIAGQGYFDQEILPALIGDGKGALDSLPPFQQANKQVIRAAVDGVFGHKVTSNVDGLLDAVTKRKTAERAAQEAPTSWGPGNSLPLDPNGRLPQHIREALTNAQREGIDFTEDDFKVSRQAGGTLEGWMAAAASNRKPNAGAN